MPALCGSRRASTSGLIAEQTKRAITTAVPTGVAMCQSLQRQICVTSLLAIRAPAAAHLTHPSRYRSGHIFQLGKKYSEAMQASVLDEAGKPVVMFMGCYGIGVTRIVAAAIEQIMTRRESSGQHRSHRSMWC